MIDLGYTYPKMGSHPISKPDKNRKEYPYLSIGGYPGNKKKLPIDDKQVGKIVTATVRLKVKEVAKHSKNGDVKYEYCFDVLQIEFPDGRNSAQKRVDSGVEHLGKKYK